MLIIARNKSVENKLPQDLSEVTHEMLAHKKYSKPELQCFVHCRLFETGTRPRDAEWNGLKFKDVNKGNADGANRGVDNLVSRALLLLYKPVVIKEPRDTELEAEQNGGFLPPTVINSC